jgi:hypothetical protein
MLALNYAANTYIAVSLSAGSVYLHNPARLASVHPSITYVGPVGELPDVQLVSVAKDDWDKVNEEVLGSLTGCDGVGRVDVQAPRQRVKRGGDEL